MLMQYLLHRHTPKTETADCLAEQVLCARELALEAFTNFASRRVAARRAAPPSFTAWRTLCSARREPRPITSSRGMSIQDGGERRSASVIETTPLLRSLGGVTDFAPSIPTAPGPTKEKEKALGAKTISYFGSVVLTVSWFCARALSECAPD